MHITVRRVALGVFLGLTSLYAGAQLIYGNTFPFWNVNGPLTVTGLTTLSGGTTLTGTTSLTSPAVTTSLTTPSTSFDLLNTTATTVNFGGAATTMAVGAATGTVTIGPAIVGSIATDSTSSTTGAWKTAGGLGVAKKVFVGTDINAGGQILGKDGTAASPSFSFTNDPNTGLISSAANSIGFSTDGTERWVINGSGALNPFVANTYDIGGTNSIRDIGVGRNATIGGSLIVSASASPAAADACTAGRIVWDASYVYVCTATGVWKRAALTGGY